MKRRPRIWKVLKWSGLLIAGIALALWISSLWWMYSWANPQSEIGVGFGLLWVGFGDVPGYLSKWNAKPRNSPMEWWFGKGRISGSTYRWVFVPLWIFVIVPGAIGGAAWWNERRAGRAKAGSCRTCGYDRVGLTDEAKCPECGSGIAS